VGFVLDFGENGPDIEVETYGSRSFIVAPIGFDPAINAVYRLSVHILPALDSDRMNFSFWVTEVGRDNMELDYWSGSRMGFLLKHNRILILQLLLTATRNLIRTCQPKKVVMKCVYNDMPTRAMTKYHAINDIFVSEGYIIVPSDALYGLRSWHMDLGLAAVSFATGERSMDEKHKRFTAQAEDELRDAANEIRDHPAVRMAVAQMRAAMSAYKRDNWLKESSPIDTQRLAAGRGD
jgi:hypothetical protein